jgi:hypothetical protein
VRELGLAGLLGLVGGASGLAAVVLHAEVWGWALAVLSVLVTALALPPRWWARLPFCWGWSAVVLWLARARPEGDYLISADRWGYGLLGVALVVAAIGVSGLARRRDRTDTGTRGGVHVG